jgi:hypothetical protein
MRNRDFDIDDALLIQRSDTIRLHFINYLARFSAFDPDLNLTFANNWLLSIDECEAHPTDETTLDEQQHLTDELEQAIKEGFAAANDLEYYVKKAFPGDKSYREEFGFGERTKARQRTLNLLIWLEVMIKIANDYPAELAAVNMPASVLTNLQAKQQNAVQKEIAQEYFKRMRKRLARQRVKNFNTLYGFFTRINNAAQIVFANEKEERELFELG